MVSGAATASLGRSDVPSPAQRCANAGWAQQCSLVLTDVRAFCGSNKASAGRSVLASAEGMRRGIGWCDRLKSGNRCLDAPGVSGLAPPDTLGGAGAV